MRKILALISFWLSSSVWAQTTSPITTPSTDVTNVLGNTITLPNYGAGALDGVYNTFVNSIGNINLTGYIAGLFWTLACLSLLWQLIQHALNRGEFTDVMATLVRWMLFTGIAWVFIAPGGYMWQAFTSTMFGDVAFSQGQVTPSGIVDIGIAIMTAAWEATSALEPMTWINAIISVGVFLLMLSVALEFLVLMIAANIYINVGVVCLGFAGSTWTKEFAFGYFKGIFIAALQVLGLIVIIKIAQAMFVQISSDLIYPREMTANARSMWDPMIQAFIVGLAMKLLSGRVPAMLAGILSGNFAYSSGGAMGAAMAMGAGALAMGAGAISLGKAATMNKLSGSLLQGLGSGANALGRAGLAASSAYQGGAGLRGTLGAGMEGLKSGFSEFSKAAGQSQDAVASAGATQSASASASSGEGSANSAQGSSQGNGQSSGANGGGSSNIDSSGAGTGEARQSGSGGVSAAARSASVSEGISSSGSGLDSNSAVGSAAVSHSPASVAGAVSKMAGAIVGGAAAVSNIDSQGSQQSSQQVGNPAGELLSRAGQDNQSENGEVPLSDRADGTVSPQGVESTGSWSQFDGRINTAEQDGSRGSNATGDSGAVQQVNGEGIAQQSADLYPQASRTAHRVAKGFSMMGKALYSLGGWSKKQKVGRSLAYGIGGFAGNLLGSRNITGL